MLEKSFGMLFFLKATKNKNALRYVYLRITVDGQARELSTKMSWDIDRWNQAAGRATGNREDARILNNFLEMLAYKIQQARTELMLNNTTITAELLKNRVIGQAENKRYLLLEFAKHNKQMAQLLGKEYAPATLVRYQTALAHATSFISWKYDKKDLELKELDFEFVTDFEFFLKSKKDCAHNSAMKYIANLKKIVLGCMKKNWLQRNPFEGFEMKIRDVPRAALTQSEVNLLAGQAFETARLSQVRDIFLFCCYTGLSYVDVKQLTHAEIILGEDGEKWLISSRQKTATPTRLPLLPQAVTLLEKYRHHIKCVKDGLVFPVLSNQRMNAYLKEIAVCCGLAKRLTFHLARHTFATTITLANGVPLHTVSKMLGHKTIQQTEHYAKLVDKAISEDMAILKNKLNLKALLLTNPPGYN